MDKAFLLEQLSARLQAIARQAERSADDARVEAKTGANRAVNLAKGTLQRALEAQKALESLEAFRPRPLKKAEPISLGAVVELENDEGGKTLFLAPAGAGEELAGPGGDGFFHVVTPASPLGRAIMGKRVGDVVEIQLQGDIAEWTISFAA